MDTSSDSFAWTDASSDSSKNMAIEVNLNGSGQDCGDACKDMLHKEPSTVCVESKQTSKKWKKQADYQDCAYNYDTANGSIKSEPNSDFDISKSKKKMKSEKNMLSSNCNEPPHEAEDYLNLRVKQEQASFVQPIEIKSKKKKKRKKEIEDQQSEISIQPKNESDSENHSFTDSSFAHHEYSPVSGTETSHKKKKKEKKHSQHELVESAVTHKRKKKTAQKTDTNETLLNDHRSEDDSASQKVEDDRYNIASSTVIINSEHENCKKENEVDENPSILLNSTNLVDQVSLIDGPLKKRSRISDKIRFEDDIADFEPEEQSSTDLSIQLQQFISINNHLKPMHTDRHSGSIITENDEVWLLKGPHKVAIGDLEKTNLILDSKRKVKINGISYDSIIDNSICSTPILLFDKQNVPLKNMTLKGIIHLRNRVPKVHIPYESLMVNTESNFIPLPDTKTRHPLFGVHYKKASKIAAAITKRFNTTGSTIVPLDVVNKKKKKHKIKEKLDLDTEVHPNVEVVHHHKKKRKHSDENAYKKAKRMKHKPDCVDAWESEQAIENNLFNS